MATGSAAPRSDHGGEREMRRIEVGVKKEVVAVRDVPC
jgi:hypothetical protein